MKVEHWTITQYNEKRKTEKNQNVAKEKETRVGDLEKQGV